MIPETDRAYIAGLFDGEGSIHFKRGPEKKKKLYIRTKNDSGNRQSLYCRVV